jgi:CheY-like chemotaxis protein
MVSAHLDGQSPDPAQVAELEQALDALGRESFDLVILDMQMPVIFRLQGG